MGELRPANGDRQKIRHVYLNLAIVWTLTGLWHGASWNFVLWGFYFFVILAFERVFKKQIAKIPRPLQHVLTLLLIMETVAPPGVGAREAGIPEPEAVGKAGGEQLGEFRALLVGEAGAAAVRTGVLEVDLLVRDVEIPAGDHGLPRVERAEVLPEGVVPRHEHRTGSDGGVEPLGKAAAGADVQIGGKRQHTGAEVRRHSLFKGFRRFGRDLGVLFRAVGAEERPRQIDDHAPVPAHA